MIRVSLERLAEMDAGADALGAAWRALEAGGEPSIFQSWTWLGCLVSERFDRPVLLRAERAGETVALALLNERGGRLLLAETGSAEDDAVFVEHNGILAANQVRAPALAACARALARRRVRLSGVTEEQLRPFAALRGILTVRQSRIAPRIELRALPAGSFLESIGHNTRYQIRRSERCYGRRGALAIERAATVGQGHAFLDALAALHQRHWRGKGRPGAFASERFARFHRALVARGLPSGEVELLRAVAGETTIGFLYNLVFRGTVYAYQSGFDYAAAGKHEKPGLTAHHLAIEHYRARDFARYDFLAGEDRYKTSLANASAVLHWAEYEPRFSTGWIVAGARRLIRPGPAPLSAHRPDPRAA